jgi:hypothetical protein
MTERLTRLVAVANGQHGAFSNEQAHDSGVPDHVLRGWITSGLLQPAGVRTLRAATSPNSVESQMAAFVVDIKPEFWFSFRTSAALLGVEGFALRRPFDVTLARGSWVARVGLTVHTSIEIDPIDTTVIDGFQAMSAARTVIDLAPSLSPRQLTVLIDGFIRDRLTTELEILERVAALRTQGRAAIPKLIAVLDGAEPSKGGHSWLERRFLDLLAAAGMPRPTTQAVVGRVDGRVIRVDCRFPGTPVVVELLGYRWHRTKEQMQRDTARMNRMMLDDLVPLQFTYDDMVSRPTASLGVVDAALRHFPSNAGPVSPGHSTVAL